MEPVVTIAKTIPIIVGAFLSLASVFLVEKCKERRLVSSFLKSIRIEIETLFERYMEIAGDKLEQTNENEPFTIPFRATHDYFSIYHGQEKALGLIKEDDLRQLIVKVYSRAKAYLDTLQNNNKLISKYEKAYWLYKETNQPYHMEGMNAYWQALLKQTDILRKEHKILKPLIKQLIQVLENKICS